MLSVVEAIENKEPPLNRRNIKAVQGHQKLSFGDGEECLPGSNSLSAESDVGFIGLCSCQCVCGRHGTKDGPFGERR